MSVKQLVCIACGDNLKQIDDTNYVCPSCGKSYRIENDTIVTNISNVHNENVVNNYYGNVVEKTSKQDKIDDYFELVVDNVIGKDYSNADSYIKRIQSADPKNAEAKYIKRFLDTIKVNGRYKNGIDVFIDTMELFDLLVPLMDAKFTGNYSYFLRIINYCYCKRNNQEDSAFSSKDYKAGDFTKTNLYYIITSLDKVLAGIKNPSKEITDLRIKLKISLEYHKKTYETRVKDQRRRFILSTSLLTIFSLLIIGGVVALICLFLL